MGKKSSADVGFLLIDGYDVLSSTTQLTDNAEAILQETTPLGVGWPEHSYTGVNKAEIQQEGFYDDAVGAINEALQDNSGATRLLCYGPEGNAAGLQFVGFAGALQVKYTRIAARAEMHRANAAYAGSGQVVTGRIILPHILCEDDGDSKADEVDNGASSADGGLAFLQVSGLDLDGGSKCVVKIEESATGASWNDLATFTDVTVVPAKELKTVTGTVKRHLAVSWAFTGGSDPTIKMFVGFHRL